MPAAKRFNKIAFGGIFLGLTILFLYLSFVFPTGKLTWMALGCFTASISVLEMGNGYAVPFYIAGLFLGFILIGLNPSYLMFALYALPLGVFKILIEKIKNIVLRYVVKLALFNLGTVIYLTVFQSILNLSLEGVLGLNLPFNFAILLVVLNVAFIVFDYLHTKVLDYYVFKIRSKLKIGD